MNVKSFEFIIYRNTSQYIFFIYSTVKPFWKAFYLDFNPRKSYFAYITLITILQDIYKNNKSPYIEMYINKLLYIFLRYWNFKPLWGHFFLDSFLLSLFLKHTYPIIAFLLFKDNFALWNMKNDKITKKYKYIYRITNSYEIICSRRYISLFSMSIES